MSILNTTSVLLIAAGCLFFVAGSVGMLWLPDVFTRLHATTKADNVGLGLLVIGLLLRSGSMFIAANSMRDNKPLLAFPTRSLAEVNVDGRISGSTPAGAETLIGGCAVKRIKHL